jgi:phage terminase large subunit-like protein
MPRKPPQEDVLSLLALAKEELTTSVSRGNVLTYKPYPKQMDFHTCNAHGRYVAGANRSGKTDSAVVEAIWWATDTHPYLDRPEAWGSGPIQIRFVVVDIVKGVEAIILPKLKRWCATSMLIDGQWGRSWDQRTLTFTFANKSTITFLTHQMELDKHGGVPLHMVFFDEEPPQAVFNENMMRLIDYNGYWVISATPVNGIGWTYDLLWEPVEAGEMTGVQIFQLTQADNPYLLAGADERSKFYVGMSAEERSIREEGAFVARSGLVFPNFSPQTHVLTEPFIPPREWRWYSSVDFGWNNPTAWLWHAASPDGRIVTFAEHYANNMTVPEHALVVNARERAWHRVPDVRVGDPAGNQKQMNTGTSAIAEYGAAGIYIGTELPREVMVGVEKLQQYFRVEDEGPWGPNRPRWVISPNCPNLIRELKRLRWASYESAKRAYDTNKQEEIHKKDDHAFDSIRYLASIMPDLRPDPSQMLVEGPITLSFDQLMKVLSGSKSDGGENEVEYGEDRWQTEMIYGEAY